MDQDVTRIELELIRRQLCDSAEALDSTEFADVLRGCALVIEELTAPTQLSVMDSLRMIAQALEPWASAPGEGLTVAVALLRMAADHVELGASLTVGSLIAADINRYTLHIQGL